MIYLPLSHLWGSICVYNITYICEVSMVSYIWCTYDIWYYFKIYHVCVLVAQLAWTFCDPMNCSWPGTCVRGILKARILQWVVIPLARGSSQPRVEPRDCRGDSLPSESPGKPGFSYIWLVISVGVGRVRGPSLSPSTFSNYKTGRKEDSWGLGPDNFSIPLLPGEAGTMLWVFTAWDPCTGPVTGE